MHPEAYTHVSDCVSSVDSANAWRTDHLTTLYQSYRPLCNYCTDSLRTFGNLQLDGRSLDLHPTTIPGPQPQLS